MNLLKTSTFRSIFQTFDHISDRKFKAVSLNSSQQKFLDFVIYFLCETYPKWAKGGARGAFNKITKIVMQNLIDLAILLQ